MGPKFIYFDLGNVVLNFDHDIACRQMAAVSQIQAKDVRRIVFESDLQTRFESGEITKQDVYHFFCHQARDLLPEESENPDMESLERAGSAIFQLNRPVVQIVEQLRRQGKKLGLLSNTCTSHWEYVLSEYARVMNLFEVFVLSHEVKAMKPLKKIYDRAVESAECKAAEIFFVDDRPENVEGALRSGLDAVQFISPNQLVKDLQQRGIELSDV